MIEMILPIWAATAFPNALKIYCHPKKTDSAGQNKEEDGIIVTFLKKEYCCNIPFYIKYEYQ